MTYPEAMKIALSFLERRMRTEHEVRTKFRDKKIAPQLTDQVIARLIELDLINDAKYIEQYVYSAGLGTPKGAYRLTVELLKRGVSRDLIEEQLESLDFDEVQLASQALAKRQRILKEPDPMKRRDKLMRYLAGRGFGYEAIRQALEIEEE